MADNDEKKGLYRKSNVTLPLVSHYQLASGKEDPKAVLEKAAKFYCVAQC